MNSVNKKKLVGQLNIYCSVLTLLVICVSVTILSPSFLSIANLFNVSKQATVVSIVGYGVAFATLIGGIDLSVGSILGLAGVLTSGILGSTGDAGAAILVALVVGVGYGAVNDFFVAVCEIPPFISTLDTMTLLCGCILVYTKGSPIPTEVGVCKFFGRETVVKVPVPVIILITLFLTAHRALTQVNYGRNIYTFGGNREAVRLFGISVRFTGWMAYTLNGLICGVADVIPTVRLDSIQSTSGTGIEMDAIATVILGGTPLSGGAGFMPPTVVGAMTIDIVDNILTLMNVNPHVTNIVKGAVILITVLADKKMKGLSTKTE